MKYKLLKQIQDGTTNCGYQLMAEDNSILFANRSTVINLTQSNSIIDVKYNKLDNSLFSINSAVKLNELDVINLQDIYNKINISLQVTQDSETTIVSVGNTQSKTSQKEQLKNINKLMESDAQNNIKALSYNSVSYRDIRNSWVDRSLSKGQQAKEFLRRNKELFDLYISDDYVIIRSIKNIQDEDTVVIPEFVGSIAHLAFSTRELYYKNARIIIRGLAKNCGTINLSGLFEYCRASSIELIVEDSDRISNMSEMFRNNEYIKSVKMMFMSASFNNLTNLHGEKLIDYMFYKCKNLERVEIYANTWGCQCATKDRIYIRDLFSGCDKLEYVDLSGFEYILNRACNINGLFSECKSLQLIDLSFLHGENLGTLKNAFNACDKLRGIDLSGLNPDTEINCFGSFYLDYNLEGVATRNESLIVELKRFNNEDLAEHNKTIRTTVQLSNGTRISIEEAERRKREMANSIAEYERTYNLLSSAYNNTGEYRLYAGDFMVRDCAEIEMKKRGMLW